MIINYSPLYCPLCGSRNSFIESYRDVAIECNNNCYYINYNNSNNLIRETFIYKENNKRYYFDNIYDLPQKTSVSVLDIEKSKYAIRIRIEILSNLNGKKVSILDIKNIVKRINKLMVIS